MAGGVLKGFGIAFVVLGALLTLGGLAAAVLGGAVFSDAVGDGSRNDCGLLRNEQCDSSASDRAEAGMLVALSGGGGIVLGLVALVVGVVLLVWGANRARRERPPAPPA